MMDDKVHKLTLTCIFILHTITKTIFEFLIHDSCPLSARGAMALNLSESQFPLSSGQCTQSTAAHTFQWFPMLVGPRRFTHSIPHPPPPKIEILNYNLILAFKMSTGKISDQRPSTTVIPSDNIHKLTLTLIFMQLLKSY